MILTIRIGATEQGAYIVISIRRRYVTPEQWSRYMRIWCPQLLLSIATPWTKHLRIESILACGSHWLLLTNYSCLYGPSRLLWWALKRAHRVSHLSVSPDSLVAPIPVDPIDSIRATREWWLPSLSYSLMRGYRDPKLRLDTQLYNIVDDTDY